MHFMLVVISLNDSYYCVSRVVIDYIGPKHFTQQYFSCSNAAFFFHLPHLCVISFYISIYTYFINLLGSNQVNVCVLWFLHMVLYCMTTLLQMSRRSSQGKDIVIDVPSSPVSKRTQCLTQDSNSERFRTLLDSHTHFSIF